MTTLSTAALPRALWAAPEPIELIHAGAVTVAQPKGGLTAATATALQRTLVASITPRQSRFVLDLEEVPCLDSTGLRVIVDAMKRARGCGGDITVCSLQPAVRSVFDMTRLGSIIEIHPSREEAIAAWEMRPRSPGNVRSLRRSPARG